jgi:hypothetical protein
MMAGNVVAKVYPRCGVSGLGSARFTSSGHPCSLKHTCDSFSKSVKHSFLSWRPLHYRALGDSDSFPEQLAYALHVLCKI